MLNLSSGTLTHFVELFYDPFVSEICLNINVYDDKDDGEYTKLFICKGYVQTIYNMMT